jgi:hypothetical protein
MSRHRVTGPPLAQPGTDLHQVQSRSTDDALAALLGHTERERLYGLVLAFPRVAEGLLTERRVPDPVLRYTLRAETVLRLNRPREAITHAASAVDHAGHEVPPDHGRLLPAATVLADAVVLAGAPDAIRSCLDLTDLARRFGDEHRATVAAGLHAAAVFHQQSCRHATHLLDQLARSCTDAAIATAIHQAGDTVTASCARRGQPHWPPAQLPVITAGGLVQPAIIPLFLRDRFQRWPGIHDCTPTPNPPRSPR